MTQNGYTFKKSMGVIIYIYYMPFARSQVLLWKFQYQNLCIIHWICAETLEYWNIKFELELDTNIPSGVKKKRGNISCLYSGEFYYGNSYTKICALYTDYVQKTRVLENIYMRCNISCGLPLYQTIFTANQNTCYISLYIHAWYSSWQNDIYFVNFKHITNNFRV